MSSKPFMCRIGRHAWKAEKTEDGHRFQVCQRCRKIQDKWSTSTTAPG